MTQTESRNPWDWMQPHDAQRMGEVIFDPAEQARWSRAVMLGGLPYMWRIKAAVVREMMYDRMALRPGDRVLILGESIASCGFIDDIAARNGDSGRIDVIDITEAARDAYISGARGRSGLLATWQYDYTQAVAAETYDVVAVLQGVQHTDDWRETAIELTRILRPGGRIVLGEITFSPQMVMKAELDLHIEYWVEKLFARMGWQIADFPYYSPEQIAAAFDGLVDEPGTFSWKGVEFFWGRKRE